MGVFFFEVVFLFVLSGMSNLIDGHLADHGAEIGCAFQALLFVEVVQLFDGAGMEGDAEVFILDGLFFEEAVGG